MRQRIRERIALLRYLRFAHPIPRTTFVVLRLLEALVPAATALATAYVISSAQAGILVWPLALLGGILLAGQALDQAGQIVRLVIAGQIDGAHRAWLAALAVSGGSLETIERQDVRDLVRTATADPRDWIEKTPSDGALAEVEAATRYFGLISSVGVLALWSPWLIIPLVVAAVLVRAITAMRWVEHYQVWARNLVDSRRYLYWGEISTSAAEAKEIRVFGFSEWLIGQHQHHMFQHLGPVWDDDRRAAKAWTLRFIVTVVPLAAVYFAVPRAPARAAAPWPRPRRPSPRRGACSCSWAAPERSSTPRARNPSYGPRRSSRRRWRRYAYRRPARRWRSLR